MDNIYRNSCRLCLKTILNKSFEVIKDVVKEILDVLLPNLNLNCGVCLMCGVCFKKMLAAFQFKSTCLYTEDKIFPYMSDNKSSLLDLREIYAKEKRKQQQLVKTSLGHNNCRLCMKPVMRNYKAILEVDIHMFQKFLPEMDFSAIKCPIVCKECLESFGIHAEFLKKCLEVEWKITSFSKEGASGSFLKNEVDIKHEELLSEEIDYFEMSENKGDDGNSYFFEEDKKPFEVPMYKCGECKYESKYKRALQIHHLRHRKPSEVQMYKCGECSFETKHVISLKRHRLGHEDPSKLQLYNCHECDYKTTSKDHFKRHQRVHKEPSKEQMYACDQCDYKGTRIDHLKRHLLRHKDRSEVQMYRCNECDYKSGRKDHLTRHQMTHKDTSEVQMYTCGKCGYETKQKSNLKHHLLIHQDTVQMYRCGECKYKTKYKKYLSNHQLKHKDPSEVKMYKCAECKYETKRKDSLKTHQLVHKDPSELQMYKCGDCAYETKYKTVLKSHQLRHKDSSANVQMW